MTDTYSEFEEWVKEAVRDRLRDLDDVDLGMVFRDGFDEIHEIADGAVPVYNQEVVNVCLDGSLLLEEPEIDGATTPIQMMQYILYDHACRFAYDAVEEFQDDEEDQRERFHNFLQNAPEEYDDCEEAYFEWSDNPRCGAYCDESWLYEEVYEEWRAERHEQ